MKNTLEEKLIKIAPILYQQHKLDVTYTAMCWGFECPDTWFDILFDLSKKLEHFNIILKEYNCSIQAFQVKEKFGYLNFYYDIIINEKITDNNIIDNINMIRESADKLVDDAEKQSWNICAFCGKPAEATTNGWITRVCMNCVKNRKLSINGE